MRNFRTFSTTESRTILRANHYFPFLIVILFVFIGESLYCQTYKELIDSAFVKYQQKNYSSALNYYQTAFDLDDQRYVDLYNAACVSALMRDKKPTINYLGQSLANGYRNQAHMYYDADLALVRDSRKFKKLLAQLKDTLSYMDTIPIVFEAKDNLMSEREVQQLFITDGFTLIAGSAMSLMGNGGYYDTFAEVLKEVKRAVKIEGGEIRETLDKDIEGLSLDEYLAQGNGLVISIGNLSSLSFKDGKMVSGDTFIIDFLRERKSVYRIKTNGLSGTDPLGYSLDFRARMKKHLVDNILKVLTE